MKSTKLERDGTRGGNRTILTNGNRKRIETNLHSIHVEEGKDKRCDETRQLDSRENKNEKVKINIIAHMISWLNECAKCSPSATSVIKQKTEAEKERKRELDSFLALIATHIFCVPIHIDMSAK